MVRAGKKGGQQSAGQKKPPLTHFLCLPLVTPESKPQLEAAMQRFRDAVTIKDTDREGHMEQDNENDDTEAETVLPTIHPKAIRPVGALHCTLGVMSLNEEQLAQAKELVENLDFSRLMRDSQQITVGSTPASAEVVDDGQADKPASLVREVSPPHSQQRSSPIRVDLKGMVSMHSPHKTSILYTAPTDPSERLYPFCLTVQKLFADEGLLVPDDRKLKLHATLVNTIYAKGRKRRPPPKQKINQETHEPGSSVSTQPADEPFLRESFASQTARQGSNSSNPNIGRDSVNDEQDRSQGHGPNANAPLKIDATAILAKFKDFVWAENMALDRIAICEMGAKKITNDEGQVIAEEYKEVASVRLPR